MTENIQRHQGKLGILIPGLGAVATTLIAGVEAVKEGTRSTHWFTYANWKYSPGKTNGEQKPIDT